MKVNREITEEALEDIFAKDGNNIEVTKAKVDALIERYDFSMFYIHNFVTLRRSLCEADDFTLFALTEEYLPNQVNEWFTESEIEQYSHDKFVITNVDFPLRFKMIRVQDDQYIGTTTAQELMKLKNAQLIFYNDNTQRTMQHKVKHGNDIWQPWLNKSAVADIRESFANDQYIPDTITLNIPDGSTWYYDETTMELVVTKMKAFDIIDGYHRHVAMSLESMQKSDFDYKMELRITQFSESKAKQFIWQEDQKTHMRKVQSESLNINKLANKIVDRLNTDSSFILSSKISRNNGLIDAAILADVIDVVWIKEIDSKNELATMLQVQKSITQLIEELAVKYPELLDNRWDKKLVLSVIFESKYGSADEVIPLYELIRNEPAIYHAEKLGKIDITRIRKLTKS